MKLINLLHFFVISFFFTVQFSLCGGSIALYYDEYNYYIQIKDDQGLERLTSVDRKLLGSNYTKSICSSIHHYTFFKKNEIKINSSRYKNSLNNSLNAYGFIDGIYESDINSQILKNIGRGIIVIQNLNSADDEVEILNSFPSAVYYIDIKNRFNVKKDCLHVTAYPIDSSIPLVVYYDNKGDIRLLLVKNPEYVSYCADLYKNEFRKNEQKIISALNITKENHYYFIEKKQSSFKFTSTNNETFSFNSDNGLLIEKTRNGQKNSLDIKTIKPFYRFIKYEGDHIKLIDKPTCPQSLKGAWIVFAFFDPNGFWKNLIRKVKKI